MEPLPNQGLDLEALWQSYKEAVNAGGNAQALYQERIWPVLLEKWRQDPPVYPSRQPFQVSIHTLGTSPEATALAILGAGAGDVYVLHTPESARFLSRLRQDTGKDLYPIEIGKSDVAAIYREVKRLLEKHPGLPVALDLTSGTKAMSAGLAAAGFFFQRFYPEVRVVYVDNEVYDPELRRPKAGTERLIILPNPHEVLAEVDALLARELYTKGEFGQAAKVFGEMVGKTGDRRYELYAVLCQMYQRWYDLDFGGAAKEAKKLLGRLSENTWLNHPLNQNRGALEGQARLLEEVEGFLRSGDFGQRRGILGLAATLLHLAQREEARSLTLAGLYAYRALELLLQERLARLGRRAEAPGLSQEEQEGLRRELAALLSLPEGEVRVSPKLGLLDLVAFLRLKGDPLLAREPLERLRGLSGALQARNASLLVHGLGRPSDKDLEQVRKLARSLLEGLQREVGPAPRLAPVELGF